MTNVLLYTVTVLIWGSTWFAIEFQLGTVAVEVSLTYRYLSAAALLFAWCGISGRSLRFDARAHRYFALLGVFLFGLNYILAYYAQVHITSALSAIAFSSMLWMNIFNARLFLGTRIERTTYAGAALGVVGIVILFWPEVRSVSLSDATLLGASLAIAGGAVASLGNIISQRAQQAGLPVVQSNAWGMLYGGMSLTMAALLQGRTFNFELSSAYISSLVFLVIFGSIVAFGCYLTLLGRIGAHRSGYVVVMFPIVAVILSAVFEGLTIDAHVVVGAGIALAGNLVILGGRFRRGRDQPQQEPDQPMATVRETSRSPA
jgi:drug/metabolite transporter (DMT)-like permease